MPSFVISRFYLTEYPMKNLTERGYSFFITVKREIVRVVKESCATLRSILLPCTSPQLKAPISEETYGLPDGNIMTPTLRVVKEKLCYIALFREHACPARCQHSGGGKAQEHHVLDC